MARMAGLLRTVVCRCHTRKSRTRSKPVPLSLADQRRQPIVHKVHPDFTLSPQQHGTKESLLQMNEILPAHALSLRFDRVKEALGSVLPHRTLSRVPPSVLVWPICISPARHVGAPDYL